MRTHTAVIVAACAGIVLAGCSSPDAASSTSSAPAAVSSPSTSPTRTAEPSPSDTPSQATTPPAAPASPANPSASVTTLDFSVPEAAVLASMTPKQMERYVRQVRAIPIPANFTSMEDAEAYLDGLQRLQASVSDNQVDVAGARYSVYAVDIHGIGPDKPVRIAFIPKGPNQRPRKQMEPNMYDLSHIDVPVTCTPTTIPARPSIVTCTPKRATPAGADLQVGVWIDASNAAAMFISLNRGNPA